MIAPGLRSIELELRAICTPGAERILARALEDLHDPARETSDEACRAWWTAALLRYTRDPREETLRKLLEGEIDPTQ